MQFKQNPATLFRQPKKCLIRILKTSM